MALSSRITCADCGQEKYVLHSAREFPPKICGECRKAALAEKRSTYLKSLAELTIEERLVKIEEWIYDYKPPVNPRDIIFG